MKKSLVLILAGLMSFSMVACSSEKPSSEESAVSQEQSSEEATKEAASDAASDTSSGDEVGLANPWTDITEEEAAMLVPKCFSAPEGATNVVWSKMEDGDSVLVQMMFDYEGNTFTAREQQVLSEDEADISGLFYEWTAEDDATLANWANGEMKGKTYRFIGDKEYVDLITWYDAETGAAYTLSTSAPDLDGFDIQAIAEAIYDPDKQVDEGMAVEHTPLDVTGCETFTDIVDILPSGYGYANATIGDTDALLVTEYTYDNDGNGTLVTIESDVYYYDDGVVAYAGYVSGGGTSYPLAIADGCLFVGGNHYMDKMVIKDGKIVTKEGAYEVFDENGTATYFKNSDVDAAASGQTADEKTLEDLFNTYFDAEVITFSPIE